MRLHLIYFYSASLALLLLPVWSAAQSNRADSNYVLNIEAQIIHSNIYGLKFSEDDQRFFTYTNNGEIHGWDVRSFKKLRTYLGHKGPLKELWVAGNEIISCSNDSIFIWNQEKPQVDRVFSFCDSMKPYSSILRHAILFNSNQLLFQQEIEMKSGGSHRLSKKLDLNTGKKNIVPAEVFQERTQYHPYLPIILTTTENENKDFTYTLLKENNGSWGISWQKKRSELGIASTFNNYPSLTADGRYISFSPTVFFSYSSREITPEGRPWEIIAVDSLAGKFMSGRPVYYYIDIGKSALVNTGRWQLLSLENGWQPVEDSLRIDSAFNALNMASGTQWYHDSYRQLQDEFSDYPLQLSHDLSRYIVGDTNSLSLYNQNRELLGKVENKVGIPRKIYVSGDQKQFLIEAVSNDQQIFYWEWKLGEAFPSKIYTAGPDSSDRSLSGTAGRYKINLSDTGILGGRYKVDLSDVWGYYKGVQTITLTEKTGKTISLRGHIRKPNSWLFNRDQTLLASVAQINVNNNEIKDIKIWQIEKGVEWKRMLDIAEEIGNKYADVTLLSFTSDNKYLWGAYENGGLVKWQIQNGLPVTQLPGLPPFTLSSSDSLVAAVTGFGEEIIVQDVYTKKVRWRLDGHTNKVTGLSFINNDRYLISSGKDGKTRIWDMQTGKETQTLIQFQDGLSYTLLSPQQYYLGSRAGVNELSFVIGKKAYGYEQFDLALNRPDLVMKQVESAANDKLITALEKAWKKRVRKSGLTEEQASLLPYPGKLPTTELASATKRTKNKTAELRLPLKFSSREDALVKAFRIKVNGVPLFDESKSNISPPTRSLDTSISIIMSEGKNLIQVSCVDTKGRESLRQEIVIENPERKDTINRIFIGIGISKYKDSSFNLTYPSKDVDDLSRTFADKRVKYRSILFRNKEATKTNILSIKRMLRETSPDDEVILSFNGHGLIDTSLNFYFATYDVNFNAPAEKGLSYSDISSLLDEIPARKKMILMDACHSGPIDKENSYERVLDTSADGTRRGLVLKQSNKEESNFLLGNTFRLMQTLFSDISENNGSLIIAAAGGDEVAFENNYWKNGVFTYCVRKALEEKRADLNKDGEIEVDELKKYVTEQVEKLTKGKQKPTSRQDNPKTKWVLAIDQTKPE